MTRALVISSYVAHGGVGLRAAMQVLPAFGLDVAALPTVLLSNHLGYPQVAGGPVPVADLDAMLDALLANGSLDGVQAVVTGFLPTVAHVDFARRAAGLIKTRDTSAVILVDPIMGDDPEGLYVPEAVADAIGAQLVGRADILTPNRFELSRLSGLEVRDVATAQTAIAAIPVATVAATSIPQGADELATILKMPDATHVVSGPRLKMRAHGTGDLFACLLLAGVLRGQPPKDALVAATSGVTRAIRASGDELDLELAAIDWRA